jgi:hypothetical protein
MSAQRNAEDEGFLLYLVANVASFSEEVHAGQCEELHCSSGGPDQDRPLCTSRGYGKETPIPAGCVKAGIEVNRDDAFVLRDLNK